jgi:ferric-dicitrate binding protein FerR (iron transport regulator)
MYGPESKNHSESSVLLTPGHRALWSRSDKNISIQEVDTRLYTSWTDGRIIFRHLPFKDIRKKLERHYNVAITNNDMELDNKLFTASFDIETIEQVFESFNKYYGVNYEINNNRIIIAP